MTSKAKRAHARDYYAGATLYSIGIDPDMSYGCVINSIYRCHLSKREESTMGWRNYRARAVAVHRVSDAYVANFSTMIYHSMVDLGQEYLQETEQYFTSLSAAQRYAIDLITEYHGIVRPQGLSLTDSLIKMMAQCVKTALQSEQQFVSHLVTEDAIAGLLDDIEPATAGESIQNNAVDNKTWI